MKIHNHENMRNTNVFINNTYISFFPTMQFDVHLMHLIVRKNANCFLKLMIAFIALIADNSL